MSLKIQNLKVKVEDKEILHGIDLEIKPGEIHVLMGPNGSGKSTLANALMGHPKYSVSEGGISIDGKDITGETPDIRAKLGLFLSMQYSPEINGILLSQFLRTAYNTLHEVKMDPVQFHAFLKEKAAELSMDFELVKRAINVGFSGGEKKRTEILQLAVLDPQYAILDETDSGLDVDALRIVAEGIQKFSSQSKGILLITHYSKILDYVVPDFVHIMRDGKIIKTGGTELVREIESKGFGEKEDI